MQLNHQPLSSLRPQPRHCPLQPEMAGQLKDGPSSAICPAFLICSKKCPMDELSSRSVVLNLSVVSPLGVRTTLSQGSHTCYPADQTFTLQFITVAQLQLRISNKIILWLGITMTKGHSIRKAENHYSTKTQPQPHSIKL